jgi:hypothetical protein
VRDNSPVDVAASEAPHQSTEKRQDDDAAHPVTRVSTRDEFQGRTVPRTDEVARGAVAPSVHFGNFR